MSTIFHSETSNRNMLIWDKLTASGSADGALDQAFGQALFAISQIPAFPAQHGSKTNLCSGPGSFQSLLLVHGLQCELQMHHTSRSSPRVAHIATLCTVSLCISLYLLVSLCLIQDVSAW